MHHAAVPAQPSGAGLPSSGRQSRESGSGALPLSSPVLARPAPELEAEPDMGSPQAIASLADLLDEVAGELEGKDQPLDALSLRLLALQLLHAAKQSSTPACDTAHDGPLSGEHLPDRQTDADLTEAGGNKSQTEVTQKQIQQRLLDMYSKATDSLAGLKQDGEGTVVPYVWQVVYQAALWFARTGATQEIIGGLQSCIQPYTQVCRSCLLGNSAVLCGAVLCCAVRCCAVLCCAVLCCAVSTASPHTAL